MNVCPEIELLQCHTPLNYGVFGALFVFRTAELAMSFNCSYDAFSMLVVDVPFFPVGEDLETSLKLFIFPGGLFVAYWCYTCSLPGLLSGL